MVMPYAHLDRLAAMPKEAAHEMIDLAQRTERLLNYGCILRTVSISD